jgi:hypothetical protein
MSSERPPPTRHEGCGKLFPVKCVLTILIPYTPFRAWGDIAKAGVSNILGTLGRL